MLLLTLVVTSAGTVATPAERCHPPCFCDISELSADCSGMTSLLDLPSLIPNETRILSIYNSTLTAIPGRAFDALSDLRGLSLSECNVKTMDPESLFGLGNLTWLSLSRNPLHTVPDRVFSHTGRLKVLNVTKTMLNMTSLGYTMTSLPALEVLDLGGCPLHQETEIPADFAVVSNLRHLLLSGCRVSNLTATYFWAIQNTSMLDLDLSFNPLRHISRESFRMLSSLRRLDISYSQPPETQLENLLSGLVNSSLERLTLDYVLPYGTGYKVYIRKRLFTGLAQGQLRELSMQGNAGGFQGDISGGFFQPLTSLEYLGLADNQLTQVAPHAFKGLTHVRSLDLSLNFLDCFTAHTCSFLCDEAVPLRNLEFLDLSDNAIVTPSPHFCINGRKFPKLTNLVLSYNKMDTLPHSTFLHLGRLQYLDASHNILIHVEAGTFLGMSSLAMLELSYNDLQRLEEGALTSLPSLRNLSVEYNRLTDSWYRGTLPGNLTFLNLGSNQLTVLPSAVANHSSLTVLILDYNHIHTVSRDILASLPQLRWLDLSYNDILQVSFPIGDALPSLESVTFCGNPFQCDCGIEPFHQWLTSTSVEVVDIDDHVCRGPPDTAGTPVARVIVSRWQCHLKDHLVPFLCVIATLFAVAMVLLLRHALWTRLDLSEKCKGCSVINCVFRRYMSLDTSQSTVMQDLVL